MTIKMPLVNAIAGFISKLLVASRIGAIWQPCRNELTGVKRHCGLGEFDEGWARRCEAKLNRRDRPIVLLIRVKCLKA